MTSVSPIDARVNTAANYNAVKIQVNDPKTSIPEGFKGNIEDNGIYNATNIEINRPMVEVKKDNTYDYPVAAEVVTYDKAGIVPVYVPQIPVIIAEEPVDEAVDAEVIEEETTVPAPNVTTAEDEKKNLSSKLNFHGINFKAGSTQNNKVEAASVDAKNSNIDVKNIVLNLRGEDYDKQALQMEEIAKVAAENPKALVNYVKVDIFSSLIDIVEKDTTDLEPASEAQIEARKKIIINELVKRQAEANNEDPEKVELPFELKKEEIELAMKLTSMEQAERNKEYALYSIAILAKAYGENVKEETGMTVPITDLPGVSNIVNVLKKEKNPGIKVAAIDALVYCRKPEYNEEIKSILTMATTDRNPMVAKTAAAALMAMESLELQK